ncbi:hypothetical protein O6H91_09G044400 [Diphasiastrum complanatum]|uniref:Uncharacterized protein n=1 Tax=Diphasiastrum complanatum TaxID=34168 RepID=A0ACC2CPK3_DIPCM|nr:hypothetical protein O6H91_09G044400 [Diphasiastrum complanatum]
MVSFFYFALFCFYVVSFSFMFFPGHRDGSINGRRTAIGKGDAEGAGGGFARLEAFKDLVDAAMRQGRLREPSKPGISVDLRSNSSFEANLGRGYGVFQYCENLAIQDCSINKGFL